LFELFLDIYCEIVGTLRPVCTESFRPDLSLKPGLKPENGFKSYVYQKT
jgi:hypothetical protein